MTTRFYSPVFNTALFDGPFRIYFSQSYESSALKIYHLLQTQHQELWSQLKKWSLDSKEHIFLLMYPEAADVEMVFADQVVKVDQAPESQSVKMEAWDEGLAIGLSQPQTDQDASKQLGQIENLLQRWVVEQKNHDASV